MQLDQVQVLKNTHTDSHLRQRPANAANGEPRFARSAHSSEQRRLATSYSHQADMELLQFVHEIKIWLSRTSSELDLHDAILLGSPRIFDLLVSHLSNIDINIDFRGGGLKDISLQDIQERYSLQAV